MNTVYELRKDKDQIERVQHATLNTDEFGIDPRDGLFGSQEWLDNIASGKLHTHCLRGVVTKVYMGSMGDWPEFTIRSDSGEESNWTRNVNGKEQDESYRVGNRIEIDYVVQRHRAKSWDSGAETKCVLEIRIEDYA